MQCPLETRLKKRPYAVWVAPGGGGRGCPPYIHRLLLATRAWEAPLDDDAILMTSETLRLLLHWLHAL